MKKLLLACIVGTSLFTVSCSGVKKAGEAQSQRSEFLKMKGDWQIVSIDYDKAYKIKPFDEGADAKCFIGSHWRFIPNNYSGSYTLDGGGSCPKLIQPIKIDIKSNVFTFKKIAEGTKAKQNTAGYTLNVIEKGTDEFSLEQNVPFEGSTIKVVYNFQRTGMDFTR
ncbi:MULTISPECIES: lipocalin family protein [Chryseobacterium]|uniref:Lipocalin family protein n=1 Tax=Chryseobacterium oryzae TaxID=2929799 RepID=A0ABY4BIV8_9FLAO|nr:MULTISPECIES: lipocalin family protein [Chryseobacterium]UOE37636.1 lipocalin family protein [Chryseobacterium oryzae]